MFNLLFKECQSFLSWHCGHEVEREESTRSESSAKVRIAAVSFVPVVPVMLVELGMMLLAFPLPLLVLLLFKLVV